MHISYYTSTILTSLSKFVLQTHGICPAHQLLSVPLQELRQGTAAPPPPAPAAAPEVAARGNRVLPQLLFSKVYQLLICVVPKSTDCFPFESHSIIATHARARMLSCPCFLSMQVDPDPISCSKPMALPMLLKIRTNAFVC